MSNASFFPAWSCPMCLTMLFVISVGPHQPVFGQNVVEDQLRRQVADHYAQLYGDPLNDAKVSGQALREQFEQCYQEIYGDVPEGPAAGESLMKWLQDLSNSIGGQIWGEEAWADRILQL